MSPSDAIVAVARPPWLRLPEREAERREPLNGPRRRRLAMAAQSNLTKSLKISWPRYLRALDEQSTVR